MARRRFFVNTIEGDCAELTGEEAHHLARVLRVEAGEQFEITDGRAAYLAQVVEVRKSSVRFRILDTLPSAPELPPLTLYAALFKFDRFEWMVEKVTELGAARIVPVQTARTETGLLAAAAKRSERWCKIARESAQQCRRVAAPEIAEARKLASLAVEGIRFRLEEAPGSVSLWRALENTPPEAVSLLTGSEGGWTDAEREQLNGAGWVPVSLGPTILRAETAAIAATRLGRAMVGWPFTLKIALTDAERSHPARDSDRDTVAAGADCHRRHVSPVGAAPLFRRHEHGPTRAHLVCARLGTAHAFHGHDSFRLASGHLCRSPFCLAPDRHLRLAIPLRPGLPCVSDLPALLT